MPSGPGRRLPFVSNEPIACQKTSRNTVPMVIARTPKIVIAVAAVVRLTRLEQSSPNEPRPSAVDDQHDVAADDVLGADAAEDEDHGHQRDRRGDQQEHVDERRQQLADDDRQRADRGRDEQLEGLLLALER